MIKSNVYTYIFNFSDWSALSLEQVLQYRDDEWWRNLRTGLWISLTIIFLTLIIMFFVMVTHNGCKHNLRAVLVENNSTIRNGTDNSSLINPILQKLSDNV